MARFGVVKGDTIDHLTGPSASLARPGEVTPVSSVSGLQPPQLPGPNRGGYLTPTPDPGAVPPLPKPVKLASLFSRPPSDQAPPLPSRVVGPGTIISK